jgi:hypothetical protein
MHAHHDHHQISWPRSSDLIREGGRGRVTGRERERLFREAVLPYEYPSAPLLSPG